MALLHKAELRPTKLEWLTKWLPTLPWYQETAAPDLTRVAAYRFDDPAGKVGIETMLVRANDGPLIQAPLTYREAPLEGGDDWLICTAEHSVLGRRWIYDGCGDPLYATMLAHTTPTGEGGADEFVRDQWRDAAPRAIHVGKRRPSASHQRLVDNGYLLTAGNR